MDRKVAIATIMSIIIGLGIVSLHALNYEVEIPYISHVFPSINWFWLLVIGGILVICIFLTFLIWNLDRVEKKEIPYEEEEKKKIKKRGNVAELLSFSIFIFLFILGFVVASHFVGRISDPKIIEKIRDPSMYVSLKDVIPMLWFSLLIIWSGLKFRKSYSLIWLLLLVFSIGYLGIVCRLSFYK